ncbi:peptidylprolyl isomerase [Myxococcota bacterium]|nr:peptidylprolyl isomerase [Myxococcota bacterium]MBU1430355.1 peptidylprolyl isomerase [Myxococcota bacterium]MBU1898183.1 peptidylprolyl isomerase [Myxococcota bacterium]
MTLGFISTLLLAAVACTPAESQTKGAAKAPEKTPSVLEEALKGVPGQGESLLADFHTNLGVIHCELFHKQAPKTVANFAGLALGNKAFTDTQGKQVKRPFYDGIIFHRVIPKFMIQGGDPLGTGTGGPGFTIEDEFGEGLKHDRGGLLSMANRGPNTGGSQFFITEQATPWLDNKHAIFGQCREVDLIKRIARVPVLGANRPQEEVRIEALKISWGTYKAR